MISVYRNLAIIVQEKIANPSFQKYSKNIGWMFFTRVLSMVVSLFTTTYVARHLGPANFGQLSYAISFVGLFSFIAALGIDQVLYRDLIKYPEKRSEYLGSAIWLRLIASILTIPICIFTAFFLSEKDVSILLIFIISLSFIFSSSHLITYEFQADVNQKYPSILSFVVIFILNIIKIFIVFYDEGVIYLALVVLLESILYACGYIYLHSKKYTTVSLWKFDPHIARSILINSYPLMFATGFSLVCSRIDQVLIKNMIDTTSVGLYSSAVMLSEIWYMIPAIVAAGVFPAIINAKKISEDFYYSRIKKLLLAILIVSTVIAITVTLLAKYIILFVFGGDFINAYPILQIYIWSIVGGSISAIFQQILVSENATIIIFLTTMTGMLSNIALNLAFIPSYGISGAAVANLISYLVPILFLLFFRHSRHMILKLLR